MKGRYVTVDVFTDRQFGGNQLAVIPDARHLSPAHMQSIANEFNFAETTFVLPPKNTANTANVRIFTPRAEMPFAGHPNVGTAYVLAQAGNCLGVPISGQHLTFEEHAGLVPMEIIREDGSVVGARLDAPQKLAIGAYVAPDLVAAAASLPADAIISRLHPPLVASCGAAFIFAEVASKDALWQARPNMTVFEQSFPREQHTGIHLYTRVTEAGVDLQTRMFAPLHGVIEDAATGSANVALGALLAHFSPEPNLDLSVSIAQGVAMGRPSLLTATARKSNSTVVKASIGGTCVPVMTGEIKLAE
ncbi:MAG: PhzF family phenazine biosynthesis protein [Rhodobacteraceae bacterium]|nr:PhzF family phenazine biosynthesis protein [Paracoccaceae bacterium]